MCDLTAQTPASPASARSCSGGGRQEQEKCACAGRGCLRCDVRGEGVSGVMCGELCVRCDVRGVGVSGVMCLRPLTPHTYEEDWTSARGGCLGACVDPVTSY
eukprot:16655-Chlamydomonas_euryale.AAC.1